MDSQSFHLHIDDVELYDAEGLSLAAAKQAARVAATKSGCDGSTLEISADADDLGQTQNACREIIPGHSISRACYINASEGYFIITEAMSEQIVVTWSRWD